MAKKIELKEKIDNNTFKSDDGLVYRINDNGESVSVGCANDARETIELADIASEVVIEGKTYPVTHTKPAAFSSCKELKTVIFPESMKCIVMDSFYMPAESWEPRDHPLPKLKKLVFNGCRDFENFDGLIQKVDEIEYDSIETLLNMYTDAPCKSLVKRKPITSRIISIGGKELTDLVVPEGTTMLHEGFLANLEGLRSVVLPSSLKTIGDKAFFNCKNLEKINFPEGLEAIGKNAFHATGLHEIVIPKGCKLLGFGNFSYCEQLTKVTLPEDITEIPNNAFMATKIESIELPEGLQTIGSWAFAQTPLKEFTIPSTVTSIGEFVFDGCGELAHVYSHIADPAACEVKSMEEKQSANYKRLEVFYCQATLHIPNVKGLATAYKKKAAWKKFSNIVADI